MRKLKKILLIAGILAIFNTNLAEAQESTAGSRIEEEENIKKGSIQIVLTDGKQGTKKEDIEFQCIKVADIVNGVYIPTESYKDMQVELNTITYSSELDEAAKLLAQKEIMGETESTDSEGEVVFNNLDTGLYLLKAEKKVNFDTISPALIAVPTWNEIEATMEYDVTVIPKHAPEVKDDETESVQTGDYDEGAVYVVMAGISILAIGLINKRKNYDV